MYLSGVAGHNDGEGISVRQRLVRCLELCHVGVGVVHVVRVWGVFQCLHGSAGCLPFVPERRFEALALVLRQRKHGLVTDVLVPEVADQLVQRCHRARLAVTTH